MQASQDQLGEPFQSIISSDLCAWCIYSLHDIENRRWFVSIIARGEAVYYKQFMLSLFNNFNPSPPPPQYCMVHVSALSIMPITFLQESIVFFPSFLSGKHGQVVHCRYSSRSVHYFMDIYNCISLQRRHLMPKSKLNRFNSLIREPMKVLIFW